MAQIAHAEPSTFTPKVVVIDGKKYVAFPEQEAEELLLTVQNQEKLSTVIDLQRETIQLQSQLLKLRSETSSAALEMARLERERADMWKSTAQDLRDMQPGLGTNILDAVRWILAGVAVLAIVQEATD